MKSLSHHAALVSLALGVVGSVTAAGAQPAEAETAGGAGSVPVVEAKPKPSEATIQEARARFDRGLQLYEDGDYELALIEFERAYGLVDNYRVLYNTGQVSIQLRQYARAHEVLEEYLKRGADEINEERRQEVLSDIDRLKSRTAHVEVILELQGAEVLVDGVPVGQAPLSEPLLLNAGERHLQIRAQGYQEADQYIVLAGGDNLTWEPKLKKVAAPIVQVENKTIVVEQNPGLADTWLWLGWGTSGVLALGAVATGVLGLDAASNLEDLRNDPSSTLGQLEDEQSRARRMFVATDVLAAGALLVGGATLYFMLNPPSDSPEYQEGVSYRFGFGPGSVSISGTF